MEEEEEEKLEMRQHLINWIDIFLKDGIVPKVVNPKAIKANYILKSKIKDKIEELKNKSGGNVFHIQQTINAEIRLLQDLLEEKGE